MAGPWTHGGPAIRPTKADIAFSKTGGKSGGGGGNKNKNKGGGVLGLFPSTSIDQTTISGILKGARDQVTKNYGASPLPTQATYLQPFHDRRTANAGLAAAADSYLTGASANAQNISGAFHDAYAGALAQGQTAATAAGGTSDGASAIPASANLEPMTAVGSSWTNYLNALRPAMATRAEEANTDVNTAENKALATYNDERVKRASDLQTAVQTLFKSNLDTLQNQKNDDYKNAVTAYAVLGKDAYNKALLKQRSYEFGVTAGQKDDQLDLSRDKLNNTKAYQKAYLDVQRNKAKKTGIDTSGALKTLIVKTTTPNDPNVKLGPLGQTGGLYKITPIINHAPNGTAVYGKVTRTVFVPYGQVPPTKNANRRVDFQGPKYPPKNAATVTYRATPQSWDTAVGQLRAKYGPGKITKTWLDAYFPPRPNA